MATYGNYITFDATARRTSLTTLSNGNRTVTGARTPNYADSAPFNMALPSTSSELFYMEVKVTSVGLDTFYLGVSTPDWPWAATNPAQIGQSSSNPYAIAIATWGSGSACRIYVNGSFNTMSTTMVNNDRLLLAIKPSTGKVWVGMYDVSGTSTIWIDSSGTERTSDEPGSGTNATGTIPNADLLLPGVSPRQHSGVNGNGTLYAEEGDWIATVPNGAKAIATQNLPTPAPINYEDEYYIEAGISHSNGSTTAVTLPWSTSTYETMVTVKRTDSTGSWYRVDTLRGGTKAAQMEGAAPDITNSDGGFSGTSFVITSDYASGTYLLEATKYGLVSATAANEQGSINTLKTTSNNDSKAFMLTWTGTTQNGTLGHGLDVAPDFLVACDTDTNAACDRFVFHKDVPSAGRLFLNSNAAADTNANAWQNTAPSTTLVSVGTGGLNGTGTSVMWGYANSNVFDFGIYDSNNSADGPMILLNGSPATFGAKRNDGTWNWVQASQVLGSNENYQYLENNNTTAVNSTATVNEVDFLSNGVKMRDAGNNNFNGTAGADHYYYSFGIQPLTSGGITQGRAK